ncbi:hypothetical protein TUBRATIS_20150 [Tubulinosema ratisbonensis]|uniref:Uncharacterized protein n=1 Tax=Tubulinosema ratisbonensis TaxID=291195 RepID=A0A437AK14_9MICR|nr:hypothetical protein TUBRATIS_20150 [Tubulinosema ratisbonensis]
MNKKLKRRSRKKFRKPRNKLRKKSCLQKEKINEINCYFGNKLNILKIINEFYENEKWLVKENYSKKITKLFYDTLVYYKNKIRNQISNESIEKEIFEEIVIYSTKLMDENEERDVYDMISKKLIFLTKLKKNGKFN